MKLFAFILSALSLSGVFFLCAMSNALRRLHKRESKKVFKLLGHLFFYRSFFNFFFSKDEYEGILFSTLVAQNLVRFICIFTFSLGLSLYSDLNLTTYIFTSLIFLILFLSLGDYLPRILGSKLPNRILWLSAPFSSVFLGLAFPFTYIFIKISQNLWYSSSLDYLNEPMGEIKQEILEIIQEAKLSTKLTPHDKKLIESVVHFQHRVAREIMVPRIDVFSLNAQTSIQEAAKQLQDQGYSRVPVYKDTIDHIVGVLMYKDVLTKYMEYFNCPDIKILEAPIETIIKNISYTPETKKISNLLQEFRKKQSHLAIVVDEYGGTEGIVTIEDILEEIVGEIEDEYDQEADLFTLNTDGSWTVDARMSILDLEQELKVHIPQESDYDTIGGYIFHRAGSIPSKGFKIKLDEFELEVLKSDDRRVEKVKIKQIHVGLDN